tara:strand:+ start:4448 stop:4702 length:255 start_codon:yes stop_codon:yes gene_type:complete
VAILAVDLTPTSVASYWDELEKIAKKYSVRGASGGRAHKGAADGVKLVLGKNVSMSKLKQYKKSSPLHVGGDEAWANVPATSVP